MTSGSDARAPSDPLPGETWSQGAPPVTLQARVLEPVLVTLTAEGGQVPTSVEVEKLRVLGLSPIFGWEFTFNVTGTVCGLFEAVPETRWTAAM
jgi:hypothetical protein